MSLEKNLASYEHKYLNPNYRPPIWCGSVSTPQEAVAARAELAAIENEINDLRARHHQKLRTFNLKADAWVFENWTDDPATNDELIERATQRKNEIWWVACRDLHRRLAPLTVGRDSYASALRRWQQQQMRDTG